jgi:hypothetical protein
MVAGPSLLSGALVLAVLASLVSISGAFLVAPGPCATGTRSAHVLGLLCHPHPAVPSLALALVHAPCEAADCAPRR